MCYFLFLDDSDDDNDGVPDSHDTDDDGDGVADEDDEDRDTDGDGTPDIGKGFIFFCLSICFNTSYLTDSYISFTLNLECGQNFCSNRSIRSSTYGKKIISDFPPCGKLVIFVNEFVMFLKTSK